MVATLEYSNTAEIGATPRSTVTVANSGHNDNDSFTTVTIEAGTTLQTTNVEPITDTTSYEATLTGSSNTVTAAWATLTPRNDFTYDFAFTIPTNPPNTPVTIARFYTDTAATITAATLCVDTTGYLYIDDTIDTRVSPPTPAPAPGNYIGKLRSQPGQISFDIYPDTSTTPTATILMTGLSTFPIGNAAVIRLAAVTGTTTYTWKTDTLRIGFGGYLPRLDTTTTPPTCGTGPDAYATIGDIIPMAGTDTAPAGRVTDRTWVWVTLPDGVDPPDIIGNTTANATFTPTAQGYYQTRYLVSDNQGADSAPAYMQTWVAPLPGDPVTTRNDILGTRWVVFGGGSSDTIRLNDTDTTTGVISTANPTGSPFIVQMNPHGPGPITLTITGNSTNGTITRTVKWFKADGTTLVDTQTGTAPTSTGDQVFTMSGTGLALIPNPADRAELWVHIESTV